MSALSAALLVLRLQFRLLFFCISVARQHQHCTILVLKICNIGWNVQPSAMILNWFQWWNSN